MCCVKVAHAAKPTEHKQLPVLLFPYFTFLSLFLFCDPHINCTAESYNCHPAHPYKTIGSCLNQTSSDKLSTRSLASARWHTDLEVNVELAGQEYLSCSVFLDSGAGLCELKGSFYIQTLCDFKLLHNTSCILDTVKAVGIWEGPRKCTQVFLCKQAFTQLSACSSIIKSLASSIVLFILWDFTFSNASVNNLEFSLVTYTFINRLFIERVLHYELLLWLNWNWVCFTNCLVCISNVVAPE